MMSRGDRGIPRQERKRTPTEDEAPAPAPVKTIVDGLRQWSFCKTVVHQFKLIAERIIPRREPTTKRRKKGEGKADWWRHPWSRVRPTPKVERGLAAVKHEQQQEARANAKSAEHQTAEEVTRPAVSHVRQSFFSAFRFH